MAGQNVRQGIQKYDAQPRSARQVPGGLGNISRRDKPHVVWAGTHLIFNERQIEVCLRNRKCLEVIRRSAQMI